MTCKFQIRKADDGEFYFVAKTCDEVIFVSRFFHDKTEAQDNIDAIKLHATNDGCYARRLSPTGQAYFIFRIGFKDPIGQSRLYGLAAAMENSIEEQKQYFPDADIEDLSA